MRDFGEDLKIDENDLEGEWTEHPSIYMYWGEKWAEAVYERDRLKLKMDIVESELSLDVRTNWQDYGLTTKPTEAAIKNVLNKEDKYVRACKNHLKAVKNVNVLSKAVSAFEHRKKALENKVSLLITGFHSEPGNKTKKVNKEIQRASHSRLKKGLKKRSNK